MKQSIPRLRSVTWKDGRAPLRVFSNGSDLNPERAIKRAEDVVRVQGKDVAGMAIVTWGADLTSTAGVILFASCSIPSILVPHFVKDRLLAHRIEAWTLDSVNGLPPEDGAA